MSIKLEVSPINPVTLLAESGDPLITLEITGVGIQGPPGSEANTARVAGEAIGGHRAVYIGTQEKAFLADKDMASAMLTFGVSVGAAAQDDFVFIKPQGELVEPSWNWSQAPVWLGDDGLLTQTVPTSGYLVRIGVPLGPTSLLIDPQFIAKL